MTGRVPSGCVSASRLESPPCGPLQSRPRLAHLALQSTAGHRSRAATIHPHPTSHDSRPPLCDSPTDGTTKETTQVAVARPARYVAFGPGHALDPLTASWPRWLLLLASHSGVRLCLSALPAPTTPRPGGLTPISHRHSSLSLAGRKTCSAARLPPPFRQLTCLRPLCLRWPIESIIDNCRRCRSSSATPTRASSDQVHTSSQHANGHLRQSRHRPVAQDSRRRSRACLDLPRPKQRTP